VKAYGDRVKNWITLNEIICFTRLGYGGYDKAPGVNDGEKVVNQTYHTALLAHGEGVRAVRQHGGQGARVGLTDNSQGFVPATETPADIEATKAVFRWENTRIFEPIFNGRYDPAYLKAAGKDAPKFRDEDFKLIAQPTDFLGLNIYFSDFVRAGKNGRPERLPFPPNYPAADSPWLKIVPQGIYWTPRLAAELYGVKNIYITENGAGYDDLPPVKGEVLDLHRVQFLRGYLNELHRAVRDGVPVRGYFLWSFMDNFEWQDGYNRRFGVTYCDFKTQKRTPKASARYFSEVMRANAVL
jgi:beta-glucosidase